MEGLAIELSTELSRTEGARQILGLKKMATDVSQRALRLAVEISATVTDPDRWMSFVRLLADDLGGAAIGLTLEIPNIAESRLVYRHNLDPSYNALTARAIAASESPWRMDGLTDCFVRTSPSDPKRPVSEVPYYKECLIPQGVAPELPIAHVFARKDERDLAAIIIYRMEQGRPFTVEDLAVLNLLPPFLANAYSAYDALRTVRQRQAALSSVVDRFPNGVLLLNGQGRVVEMNQNAKRILEEADGFAMAAGCITATDRGSSEALQARIEHALGRSSIPIEEDPLAIERPSGLRPYSVIVSNLSGPHNSWAPRDVAAALFVSDPESRNLPIRGTLNALYNLTEAESDLTALLCQGNSLAAAATQRGVSIHTARSQLKSIFRKTGTRRQGDLVVLTLACSTGLQERRDAS